MTALRLEVRSFLREIAQKGVFTPGVDTWLTGWDEDFSRTLAAHGWIGMTIPTEYGGRGRTHLERFVVTEELLAAGAPVAAHWIADRQIAPSLLAFGTEEQKQRYLPKIAAGEAYFGIGMSEPDSGSDLASVRTRAVRVDGGWQITGNKVWTSNAHRSHAFFVLARSAPQDPKNRHQGLSQFIVDLRSPGVDIRPIVSMGGSHHFNEVFLQDVLVPDESVLGTIGEGWKQVNHELGFERSGPERLLSTYQLFTEVIDGMRDGSLRRDANLGRLFARLTGLHRMSLAVAGALQRDEPADTAAALVKLLGTTTEGDLAEFADLISDDTLGAERYERLLRESLIQRPGFTLRGGTNEVLRGVIARGLGMR
ncbi:acyl-CoA dehydrogenase family protein [Streptosporangium sp. NPDC000563]|uniref:acyl-CoA dehydrogenase family protein n=1 Tax=unclassified Streptosporangium TaxID=2632669 RepID=UPI00332C9161